MKIKKQYCEHCGAEMTGKTRIYGYEENTGKAKTTTDWKCPNASWWDRNFGDHQEFGYD